MEFVIDFCVRGVFDVSVYDTYVLGALMGVFMVWYVFEFVLGLVLVLYVFFFFWWEWWELRLERRESWRRGVE